MVEILKALLIIVSVAKEIQIQFTVFPAADPVIISDQQGVGVIKDCVTAFGHQSLADVNGPVGHIQGAGCAPQIHGQIHGTAFVSVMPYHGAGKNAHLQAIGRGSFLIIAKPQQLCLQIKIVSGVPGLKGGHRKIPIDDMLGAMIFKHITFAVLKTQQGRRQDGDPVVLSLDDGIGLCGAAGLVFGQM